MAPHAEGWNGDSAVSSQQLPNLEEARAKYAAERDVRLKHGGGVNQFRLTDESDVLSRYLDDPWSQPNFDRQPVAEEVDVVIIGAGFAAILVAVRLIEQGITNIRMIDKAGDFGGAWYWNRFPGVQCDVESYIYMPLLEELGYMPTQKYASGKEILKHAQAIGRKYGLYERALFQTEARELRWNEKSGRWSIKTSRNDDIQARFVVPVAGPLQRPHFPGIKGIEDFKGHSFHASRWDFNYTGGDSDGGLTGLANKKVAVIGTGATAIQVVPKLSKYAKELYVFQRTPSVIGPRGQRKTDEAWAKSLKPGWQRERMLNFEATLHGQPVSSNQVDDFFTDVFTGVLGAAAGETDMQKAMALQEQADFEYMDRIRARCDEFVHDKATAESLKPWYNIMCKRFLMNDDFLPAFNNPNTHLIDTQGKGVERITEKAVVANGKEFDVDCIIYCSGFEFGTSWTHRSNLEIYGRDGETISNHWKDGTRTYHGWVTRKFPNVFWLNFAQAALTPNNLYMAEEHARHISWVIRECEKRGIRSVEATEAAEQAWVEEIVQSNMPKAQFFAQCTPGYFSNEGTPDPNALKNAGHGAGAWWFFKMKDEWRAKGDMEGLDVKYLEHPA